MSELPEILSLLNRAKFTEGDPSPLQPWASAAGFDGCRLPTVQYQYNKQVHGTSIVRASRDRPNATLEADGIWTDESGLTIAVRTADCLPVLFADKQRRIVMAVHAGWRGLTAGILREAVQVFSQQNIAPTELVAAIGPAISRECYEVGPEVIAALYAPPSGLSPLAAGLCVAKGRRDRWHLDLQSAAVLCLAASGLPPEQISVAQICTFKSAAYNSYRREGKGVASNISWISL